MIPDNYDAWLAHNREEERQRERLPKCENPRCGCRIMGDYYWKIEGEILCEDCAEARYRHKTEDYE